ncbi:MAG: S9 family peptidase [Paludibacteraceae bacterium]|nr:S9 family peptidase [Paludibacteraceae bacterium]
MSALTLLAATGCVEQNNNTAIIGKNDIKIEGGRMTAEALWAMGRIGSAAVSDYGQLAYQVTYYSVAQNKSNTELFVISDEGKSLQLTHSAYRESDPAWLDEERIAYLSNKSGSSQIWTMDKNGNDCRQLSYYDGDIEGFKFSKDGKKVVFVAQVKTVKSTQDIYPDLDKATGRIVDDLMYKHWDEWTETAPHPFIAEVNDGKLENIIDILEGQPYESPMKPFGGIEQIAWSPDGTELAYTCRKKTGLEYAVSTNSDIYLYNVAQKTHKNITQGMMGYDTNPQYSPDGTRIAWLSMERDGYESDQNRLFVMNLETGEKTFLSKQFESNVDEFLWLDNFQIAFAGCWHALEHIYLVDMKGKVLELTDGQYDYSLIGSAGDQLYLKRHSMREADEIFSLASAVVDIARQPKVDVYREESMLEKQGILCQLTFENKHIYDQVEMGRVVPRWQKTTDGKQMLTWIIYPPEFDPQKKYPTLLYCEGGPQSPVSQFWSYRWNFMMMSAHDYIVVAPNRRGLPGFGLEWNEQISGDYAGQCMKDYLTAIDEFCSEPYVDREHLGCVGASFGGYSVYWLAGNHNKRFKAFIAHDGIFNMEMQYLETEEKWFANWDMGGAYWEKDNAVAQRTFKNSPHLFVDRWDTPILCIHGEKDYRILANQGMAAFDAAKMRGIPAELLVFPDENHWVLKPQNGILWQRTFYEWLDKWLKE